jgi:hypothetical protein
MLHLRHNATGYQEVADLDLVPSYSSHTLPHCFRDGNPDFKWNEAATSGSPRSSALPNDGLAVSLEDAPFSEFCLGPAAHMHARVDEKAKNGSAADPEFMRQLFDARPSEVTLDDVVEVRHFNWTGHVYSPESADGWIIAHGIYNGNCRCAVVERDVYWLEDRGMMTASGGVKASIPAGIASGAVQPDKNFNRRSYL